MDQKLPPGASAELAAAVEAARAGGTVLLEWIGRFSVQTKGPSDLVTQADLGSQDAIRRTLAARFPDYGFVGEETPQAASVALNGTVWVVDPLDGTTNYVHGVSHYAVSIALVRGGYPIVGVVFDPVSQECCVAERGGGAWLRGNQIGVSGVQCLSEALVAASFSARVLPTSPEISQFNAVLLASQAIRRTGSAALNRVYLAAGRFDAFWALSTKVWDVAAGIVIVEEAGGKVTGLDGKPLSLSTPHPIATNGEPLHAEFLKVLQNAAT